WSCLYLEVCKIMRRYIMRGMSWLGLLMPLLLSAQQEGDAWMIGYSYTESTLNSLLNLNFTSGSLDVERLPHEKSGFHETCAVICDKMGEPLLWSNGMEIRGPGNTLVEDTIAFLPDNFEVWPYKPSYWLWYHDDFRNISRGFVKYNAAVILPNPGELDNYCVIYHLCERMETGG